MTSLAPFILTGLLCALFAASLVLGVQKERELRRKERERVDRHSQAAARLDAALRGLADANRELADALDQSRKTSK